MEINSISSSIPASGRQSHHKTGIVHILFLTLGFLIVPPFWAVLYYLYRISRPQAVTKFPTILTGAFLTSFCLTYLTPIWDNIAHYFVWKTLTIHPPQFDPTALFNKSWFNAIKLFIINNAGQETPYIYFVFVTYFLLFISLGLLAKKLSGNKAALSIVAIVAISGLFPILSYTRNSLALLCVCLPALSDTKKLFRKIIYIVLGFIAAYNFHDSIIILLPSVGLYILLQKKLLDIDASKYTAGLLIVLFLFFIFPQLLFLIPGDILPAERISTYIIADGRFLFGSDYIYVTLALVWCLFLLVNILKYRDEISDKYLLSLFITSSLFYFTTFISGRYTLRIRMEFISLWIGMLLGYPIVMKNFSPYHKKVFKFALLISFSGYMILAGKPIFYAPWFSNAEECRNICLKIFKTPSVYLFDVNTHGFSNSVFEMTTWRSD